MKNQITEFDLTAAFKALDEIEIPAAKKGIAANRVNLKETFSKKSKLDLLLEDYYDVNDQDDLEMASNDREAEINAAKLAKIEKIVDLDAASADELLPNYAGKLIIQCPQCMTLFYKNEADVEHSEDNYDVVNVDEVCQHCGNSSGYTLIGKVQGIDADEAANYELPTDDDTADNELPAETEDTSDLDIEEPANEDEAVDEPELTDDETTSDDEKLDLDLDLDEGETEEADEDEEEEKNESLQKSKAAMSDYASKHNSNKLSLNEDFFDDDEEEPNIMLVNAGQCPEGSDCDRLDNEDLLTEGKDKTYVFYVRYKDGKIVKQKKTRILPAEIHRQCDEIAEDEDVEGVYVSEIQNGKEIPLDKFTVDKAVNELVKRNESIQRLKKFKKNSSKKSASLYEDAADYLKKPVTEDEVEAMLDKMFESIDDIEDLDECGTEKIISEALTKVYENVENFKLEGCEMNNGKIVLEGKINFKSGASRATKYCFTENKIDNRKVTLAGVNKDLDKTGKFIIEAVVEDGGKYLMPQSMSYSYHIGKTLVEGLVKRK